MMEIEDIEGKPMEYGLEKLPPIQCYASEKPTNHSVKSTEPLSTSEKPAEPCIFVGPEPSPSPPSVSTRKMSWCSHATLNTALILAVLCGGILYAGLTVSGDHTTKAHYDEMIRELKETVNDLSLQVNANFTQLMNLYLMLGRNDLKTNISLFDIANLVNDIQVNFTTVFDRIEEIGTSLQDLNSSTNTSLMILQRNGVKLAGNVTRLEDAAENIEGQLINLTAESNRNAVIFASSLANISADLAQLELDTTRDLARVNTTLHQETQAISERLTTFRTEAHSLVNRSVAEVFVHIENEVTGIRGHIDDQVSEVRGHIDSEVSELQGHINTQVSEVRNHVATQVSEVRDRITTAATEARRHTDNAISGVRHSIETNFNNKVNEINNRLNAMARSGANALQSSKLHILLFTLSIFVAAV